MAYTKFHLAIDSYCQLTKRMQTNWLLISLAVFTFNNTSWQVEKNVAGILSTQAKVFLPVKCDHLTHHERVSVTVTNFYGFFLEGKKRFLLRNPNFWFFCLKLKFCLQRFCFKSRWPKKSIIIFFSLKMKSNNGLSTSWVLKLDK